MDPGTIQPIRITRIPVPRRPVPIRRANSVNSVVAVPKHKRDPGSILRRSSTVGNPGIRHVHFSDEVEFIDAPDASDSDDEPVNQLVPRTRTRKRDKVKKLGKAIIQGLSRLKKKVDKSA
ncbi:hypothetical protein Q9L58_003617 [Maublancomyces gigas]|uniref:Uncharacterized protein n=1 Tax=Discina gigas TaxID=1032678 RepID=A0ABR3GNB1_9PEZI